MGEYGFEGDAAQAVAALTAAVDDLLGLPITSLPGMALVEVAHLVEVQLRRMASFDHSLVAALVGSTVYADVGARSTAALLAEALRLSPTEAFARVRAAKELGPRTDFTGGAMEPLYPDVAAAQLSCELSPAHARVITGVIHHLPCAVKAEHGVPLERFLVAQARDHAPDFVAKTAKHAVAVLDPDGTAPSEEDQQRARGLSFTLHPDGSSDLRGHLTPECTATALAGLDLWRNRPRRTRTLPTRGPRRSGCTTGSLDACTRLLGSGTLPDSGGVTATVVLTMTLQDLETRTGTATTSHGGLISIAQALRMAADADIIPVVLADSGGILTYGRTTRHASRRQRQALAARDGGCSFPGCDIPPQWCDSHHIVHWEHGGPTDLDNLTLVCGFHHREHERQGWECQMTDGIPLWLPPWWINTERTPGATQPTTSRATSRPKQPESRARKLEQPTYGLRVVNPFRPVVLEEHALRSPVAAVDAWPGHGRVGVGVE